MEITCHNCGKNVSADTPKCVFCGTVIVLVTHDPFSQQEVNRVIVPSVLSLDVVEGRASIKHKIRLQKESLLVEKKDLITPSEVKPIVLESPISPIEIEKNIPIIAPVIAEEKIILPINKEEIVVPAKEEVVSMPHNNPFDISDLIKEANEKQKQVETFLQPPIQKEELVVPEHQPVVETPIVEKELYSVSDALKEILAEEQKVKDFLAEKPIPKEPAFTEKQKSIPFSELPISLEKTEINTPPPIPDFAPIGIEKMPHQVPTKQGMPVVAWLIRHTENRKPVYYELFEGDNTIGRGDKVTPIEVDIADDKYVSRGHAWVRAFRTHGNSYIFELRDDGAKRGDKSPSMNGTYLNASMRRIDSNVVMYLQDGDTIQVGMTKLVFKVKPQNAVNQQQLFTDVLKSDYTITVIF